MTEIQSGELNQRVDIERPMGLDDGSGGQTDDYSLVASGVAAKIEPVSGNIQAIAGAANAVTIYKVKMRYREGIATGMRLIWRGKHLYIQSAVDPSSRRFSLNMVCHEGALP